MGLGISSVCRYIAKRAQVKVDKMFDKALESKSFKKWVECSNSPEYQAWRAKNDLYEGNILDKYL